MRDRSLPNDLAYMIMQGGEPFGDRLLRFADGPDTKFEAPLHLEESLNVAGTQSEVAAHQGDPGNETWPHLSGRDFLRQPCDAGAIAARANSGETLVFGNGIGNFG